MKKKFILPFVCLSFLFSGCNNVKKIPRIYSPDSHVRYAYYMECLENGYVVVFPERQEDLDDKLIEYFILADGSSHYFYPADGYEFVSES